MSIKTACFTGHRHLLQHKMDELSQLIDQAVVEAYKHGYRQFLCGGALGFDTLAASRILIFRGFTLEQGGPDIISENQGAG